MAARRRRARGGKIRDEAEAKAAEARSTSDDRDDDDEKFRRGGRARTKKGGTIQGARDASGHHLAKRARGGSVRGLGRHGGHPGSGSPFSTAAHRTNPPAGGQGHEGADRPSEVP